MKPREQAGLYSLVGWLVVGGVPGVVSSELLGSEQQCGLCKASQLGHQFPQLEHKPEIHRIPSVSVLEFSNNLQ